MVERLGIAGSGAIATGLAAVAAAHGDVLLWARSTESLARAAGDVDLLRSRMVHGREAGDVAFTTDLSALADRTLLVEAIVEDLEAKAALLGRLADLAEPDAILASTTSSLPVTALAAASGRPERFAALHVFNPVVKMELVELAFPPGVAGETRGRLLAVCEALGKTAIEVPDVPGFVVNRLLFPYLFSAIELMERTGMGPEDVDMCMMLGANHPVGPLALLDYVGLDIAAAIGDAIDVEPPSRLRELVAAGHLGRKSGHGFHAYG